MQAQQQAFAIEMPAENGYSTRMLAKTNRDILTDVQTLQGDPQDRATQKKLVKDIGYRLSYSSMQLDHMLRPVRGVLNRKLRNRRLVGLALGLAVLVIPYAIYVGVERQGGRVTADLMRGAVESIGVQVVATMLYTIACFWRVSARLAQHGLTRAFTTLVLAMVFATAGALLKTLWPEPSFDFVWFSVVYVVVSGPIAMYELFMSIAEARTLSEC